MIKDTPLELRPRERLELSGTDGLSDEDIKIIAKVFASKKEK